MAGSASIEYRNCARPLPTRRPAAPRATTFHSPRGPCKVPWSCLCSARHQCAPPYRRNPMSVLETPIILKLTPELAGILLSPEEFDAVEECDELYNYELVHGVLVVAPPPDIGEREPNEQLGYLLRFYKDHHPQGAALNLTVSEHSIRTPDS